MTEEIDPDAPPKPSTIGMNKRKRKSLLASWRQIHGEAKFTAIMERITREEQTYKAYLHAKRMKEVGARNRRAQGHPSIKHIRIVLHGTGWFVEARRVMGKAGYPLWIAKHLDHGELVAPTSLAIVELLAPHVENVVERVRVQMEEAPASPQFVGLGI